MLIALWILVILLLIMNIGQLLGFIPIGVIRKKRK